MALSCYRVFPMEKGPSGKLGPSFSNQFWSWYQRLAGGTMLFIRKYSTIWP
jgi:hypothetical protein